MNQRIFQPFFRIILFSIVLITTAVLSAQAATIYGVTNSNQLVRFGATTPGTVSTVGTITGLQGGETVLGIDFRPVTGQLYALGSNGRIYTINKNTAVANFVGTLTTALNGTRFGVDFNPVPDRIRITSDAEQNLRANPNDGTNVVDGTLAYAAGDPNNGQNPNITGSAYINSFAGATATTLYNIDSNLGILTIQNPPNNGTLVTVGSLGISINISSEIGFDITPSDGKAFASVSNGSNSQLYTINLTTGAATMVGPIGNSLIVRDIAIDRNKSALTLDFEGDGRTDFSVFRLSENRWYIDRSSGGSYYHVQFGLSQSDVITPGDFDGDGKTDVAVWRTTDGVWYVLRSSDGVVQTYQFGLNGDEPVARDYDGDGKTDFAVVRRTGGQMTWYVNNSSNNSFRIEQFGLDSDFVAPGDYDGDAKFDLGVFRSGAGNVGIFYAQQSSAGFMARQFGMGSDFVVPGDYDGDGKTDLAVVRQGTQYTWFILRSSDNTLFSRQFGAKPQFTAQGDYDGDGKTDVAVWDPNIGDFYVLRSTTGATVQTHFGLNGDFPIANYDTH